MSAHDQRAQLGFDFADGYPTFKESPTDTWNEPKHTTAQYLALFEQCEKALPGVNRFSEAAGRVFEIGLLGAVEVHALMLENRQGDGVYTLWRSQRHPRVDEVSEFLKHCHSMINGQWDCPGIDYKHRDGLVHSETAMHVYGFGTVTVRNWGQGQTSTDFKPWKTTVFFKNYLDEAKWVYAASAVFADKGMSEKLGESAEGVASVTAFEHGGQSYINTGGMFCEKRHTCKAWRFCVLQDWRGPTYSYRTQVLAWDEGRKERGDMRGMVVRVWGQQVVLQAMTYFYDDAPAHTIDNLVMDDDGTADDEG